MNGFGLLALAVLLLAAAAELWWGSAARARRRASMRHLHERLQAQSDPGSAAAALPAAGDGPARYSWHAWLLRAGLDTGPRQVLTLLLPGVLFMGFAGWRLHSLAGALAMGAIYATVLGFWLLWRADRLQRQILLQLPDFLENVVRIVSTGNSLPMAFQHAAAEVRPPLHGVLEQTLHGMRAGRDMADALHQAAAVYRIEALRILEAVVAMSERYGGRTDRILQRMADFMRDLEQAQQEVRAVTSETRVSSWVLGLLPVLSAAFMMLVDPAFFEPMFHQPFGHRLLLMALGFEALGAFLLHRLARSL